MYTIVMKTCIKCSFFGDNALFQTANICLMCHKKYKKQYYENNRIQILAAQKQSNVLHPEYMQTWRILNKENIKTYNTQYYEANKQEINQNKNKYRKERKKKDPLFKLRTDISRTIVTTLKQNNSSKNGCSVIQYLPFSLNQLKQHLEGLFESWMNWNNHGKYNKKSWNDMDSTTWNWNIDHIIPHSLFKYDSMNSKEFENCWSLSNLRPLSSKQNILDGTTRKRHK